YSGGSDWRCDDDVGCERIALLRGAGIAAIHAQTGPAQHARQSVRSALHRITGSRGHDGGGPISGPGEIRSVRVATGVLGHGEPPDGTRLVLRGSPCGPLTGSTPTTRWWTPTMSSCSDPRGRIWRVD